MRRPQDPTDNATPAGWSAAAGALLTYAALHRFDPAPGGGRGGARCVRRARAARAVRRLGRWPSRRRWSTARARSPSWGRRDDPATEALHRAALRGTAPGAAVVAGEPGADGVPLLADRPLVGGRPAAYVCRHFTCDAPTTDADELAKALR